MASGSYVANGTGGRKITGLGFRPDVVLVKGNDYDTGLTNTSAVMRTSTMSGDASKPMVLDNNLATNQITSLDADGFTLGNDRRVAANGITFYWAAFKANATMKVGTYTGDGAAMRSIGGLGLQPDFLIVLPSNASRAIQASSATPGGRSYEFDIGTWLPNQIMSLDADGFTVNHNATYPYANANGVLYHYVAWDSSPGLVRVGSYAGDATDDRNITGIGFRPEFLFVKSIYNVNSSPNLSPPGHFRATAMPYDNSYDYARTFGGNHIMNFLPDGFQIGSAMTVNRTYTDCNVDGPGCEYFYVAINNVGSPPPLATTQTSTTITVTDPNSFEMTFDQARGGNLANFYDLAEDPVRAYDLAGKPSVYFNGLFHSSMVIGGQQWASGTNSIGARLELLEATPTRVRVRQEAFYQQVPTVGTARLAAAKGIGDYSVYPEKVAIRWNRRTWAALAPQENALEIGVRREVAPDPRDAVTAYSQSGSTFPAPPTDDFVLAQHEVPGVRTDMLAILYKNWPAADSLTLATTAIYFSWRDNPAAAVPAGANDAWDLLIHYKPTNFLSNMDPAVISRRADYRTPDSLAVMVGGPWTDASENTGVADAFNEAEAAYTLTFDPALGLQFDMNGSPANPRYQPFFKIRQWRSLNAPAAVVFEGATLAKDVDYRADVKPVSRAHFAAGSVWHSTLESATQVSTSPDIGGPGFVVGPPPFVPARYGNGVDITLASQYVAFDTSNFNKAAGAIEFWFQPAFASTDGALHDICGFVFGGSHRFVLEKRADDNLYFSITAGGPTSEMSVSSANYSWQAGDWVHLRIEWNDSAPLAFQQRLTINGVEPTHTDPTVDYASTGLNLAAQFRFGNTDGDATFAPGLYDEIYVYGAYTATPIPLADGGLTSSSSEYLADSSKNFGLSLAGVDASRRGAYFYLGSDSKVRGLNVALQTLGAGVAAGALQWEYWNGTAWVSLETVGGFTDTTNSLTANGSVYWTADPAGWAPYSVNGGPDLYYLRVHLALGATYTTAPVESLIKSDILLFQYFGDVTAPAQTFQFPVAATADLAIAKSDGAGIVSAVPGTFITYTIRVTNNGPDTVASVVVTDSDQPAGAILSPSFATANGTYDSGTGTWIFSSPLQAGQYAELTLTGTIDPLARTELRNTATVAPLAGIVDTNTNNNSATDIDTLVPSVDLALSKTCPSGPVGLGSAMVYTLDVTSAPSGAYGVTLTDTLPPSMLFESATPASCSYDGSTRKVTCNLGSVGTSAQVTLTVRPQAVGSFLNTATVQGTEDPGPGGNNTSSCTTDVQVLASDVRFFTVTSTDRQNVLEWVNPTADYVDTEIRYSTGGYPKDASDGTFFYRGGVPGGQERQVHVTGSNNVTYYYGAFVHRTSPLADSRGRFVTGRTFDNTTGPVKWSFSTGATAVAPPTVGGAGVVAPSNDRVLYAMERGSGANGGEWPASWWPIELGDVVQSRSSVVPISLLGASSVVYLGAQDGYVYAVDAAKGSKAASLLWKTTLPIGPMVQAAPAGIFSEFDPTLTFSYLLVGTRDGSGGPNAFVALDPLDGSEKGRFDDSGAGLGVINGMAAVDYATRRVYFASRERVAGGNTLWCLEMKDTAPYLELRWARPLGDIDSSPVLRKEPGGAAAPVRVYVGSPLDGGTVFSIDALSGDVLLDRKFAHHDGQVKGFVFPDRNSPTGDIYFATENSVWAVSDSGGSMSKKFPEISLPGVKPSAVLFVSASQRLYFGGSDGMLHDVDVAGGATHNQVLLGGGPVTVGAPSYDWQNELVHVGTEAGVFYAVQVPLLSATCVPAASCTGVNVGQPCYISNPAVECSAYHCLGVGSCGP